MSITRRATLALATAATTLSLFAGAAMAQDDYKERIRIFYETFNQNDPNLLDQIIAEDWAHIPAAPGEEPGREGFKKLVPGFAATFGDGVLTIEDIVQEGNKSPSARPTPPPRSAPSWASSPRAGSSRS